MKKIAITIFSIFAVAFICLSLAARFANDKVYALLYPDDEKIFVTDCPGMVTLQNGDYFALGTYSGEKLVWQCVLDHRAQCEKIIEFKAYDAEHSDWSTSDLRVWLNADDGFVGVASLNKDFISGEITLLSQNDLQKIGNIAKQPTLWAIKNADSNYLFLRRNCWYWTSSSISTNAQSVATVTQNGGFYKTLPTDRLTGVCPAFTLKDTAVHILGGDGSRQKPYVIG